MGITSQALLFGKLTISLTDDQSGVYTPLMPLPRPADASTGTAAIPAGPVRRLGYLLKRAQLRFQSLQQPALAPLGLDGRLLAVLAMIGEEGPALQQRLSARLGVDRTTMVAHVDALEVGGLVERRRDPRDRRGHLVGLTPMGQKVLARGLRASNDIERTFLAPLSATQQRRFLDLLSRVATDDL
jgi:DNA-binding MarR family transcriptional regulator